MLADGMVALARGTVSGTATGRLYVAPTTRRTYQGSFFDYVRVRDGLIVERVRQADILGQMRQLYSRDTHLRRAAPTIGADQVRGP